MIYAVQNARSYYHEALEQVNKDDETEKLRSAETQKRACETEKKDDCLKMQGIEAVDEKISKL